MRLYDGGSVLLLVVAVVAVVGVVSSRWLKDDNLIEEAAEEVIEMHTGVNLDLSPDSPEN